MLFCVLNFECIYDTGELNNIFFLLFAIVAAFIDRKQMVFFPSKRSERLRFIYNLGVFFVYIVQSQSLLTIHFIDNIPLTAHHLWYLCLFSLFVFFSTIFFLFSQNLRIWFWSWNFIVRSIWAITQEFRSCHYFSGHRSKFKRTKWTHFFYCLKHWLACDSRKCNNEYLIMVAWFFFCC